jgi:hypothetical protein
VAYDEKQKFTSIVEVNFSPVKQAVKAKQPNVNDSSLKFMAISEDVVEIRGTIIVSF